jgi:hypothetical protein
MRKIMMAALLLAALAMPAMARNFGVPEKNPAVTLFVPDNWTIEQIDFGYSAVSLGKDVFFAIESASARRLDAMMKLNESWMKDNKIKQVKPTKVEGPLNGIADVTIFTFDTTDENGRTLVDFVLIPAGNERVIMLTLWGSEAERAKHKAAIDAIMNSVKSIN